MLATVQLDILTIFELPPNFCLSRENDLSNEDDKWQFLAAMLALVDLL